MVIVVRIVVILGSIAIMVIGLVYRQYRCMIMRITIADATATMMVVVIRISVIALLVAIIFVIIEPVEIVIDIVFTINILFASALF